MFAHEALLQREMRRDAAKDFAEESSDGWFGRPGEQLLVQAVDEVDQFAMLVVDGLDADAVMPLPFDQGHVASVPLSEK